MVQIMIMFALLISVFSVAFGAEGPTDVSAGVSSLCSAVQSCEHTPQYKYIGFDYKGYDFLQVDVGECTITTAEDESGQTPPIPCTCEAISYEHATYLVRPGPYEHVTVTDCQATPLTACQRSPSHYTYHAHTSYQVTVDLGRCSGTCNGSEDNCLPTSTASVLIEGPNGYTTHTKITGCGCGDSKCYRQDYYQTIKTLEVTDEEANITQIVEKKVNVGVCSPTGECRGIYTQHCIVWGEDGECQFATRPTKAICVPATTEDEEYVGADGEQHTITSISSCHCGTRNPDRK